MSYNNGVPSNNAANLPYLVKNGNIKDRNLVDDALPNAWVEYVDNFAGTGRIHYLQPADSANQTYLRNPNGTKAYAFNLVALATPAAPTITNAGTVGVVTWAYKVVARNGAGVSLGTTPASAAGSTTTGNATLTSANYNIITFASVTGAAFYDIYRTTAGTTPSTTGKIGTVAATISQSTGIQPATYVLNDTALAADGTTAPTVNTSGGLGVGVPLTTPVGGVATVVGTAGATTITYKVVARGATGTTAASGSITTTTANATLSTTNYVTVTWNPVPGAASYDVYRTAAGGTPSSTGLIANVAATLTTLSDTGLAGDSTTAPTVNTTGGIVVAQATNYIAATTGSANALSATLANSAGNNVAVVAGLQVVVKLGAGLQAGANSFNLNAHGADAVKKSTNPATDLGTAYVTGSMVSMVFDGTVWQVIGQ